MPLLEPFKMKSRKNKIHRRIKRKADADELAQGITLLQAKKFMNKSVGKNYKLMEAFTGGIIEDPVYTNNEVPTMPGPKYTGAMSEIQSPVTDINQAEMDALINMENEFQQTLSQWGQMHSSVVSSMMNLPKMYEKCLQSCDIHADVDTLNACKYGCNIGKYAAESDAARKKSGNTIAPTPRGQFSPHASAATLAAGPLYKSFLTQLEGAGQLNPTMSQSTLYNLWQSFYKKACSDAIAANESGRSIGAGATINANDKRQRYCSGWQETLGGTSGYWGNGRLGEFIPMGSAAACDTPIEVGQLANNAGKSGYCVCADGRKVGYSDAGHPAFTCNDLCAPQNKNSVGIGGQKTTTTVTGETGPPSWCTNGAQWAARTGQSGCVWSAGAPNSCAAYQKDWCTSDCKGIWCGPGDKNADCGGGGWCQKVPAPKVDSSSHTTPAAPFYNNPDNWSKSTPCKPCPGLEKHWSLGHQQSVCASAGPGCCTFNDEAITNTCDESGESSYCEGSYCPTPPGDNSPESYQANNYFNPNITPLPTTAQLLQECEDQMAAFAPQGIKGNTGQPTNNSLYSAILALGKLETKLEQQAEAIYAKIKSSSMTRNQIAVTRTSAGQSLLKHLDIYEQIYRRLHVTKQKQLNMAAMAEDVQLKVGSANITYMIWFILAMSSMFLVIKHLRK